VTIHTLTAQSIAIVTIAYKNLIELAIKFHQDGRGAKKNRQKHNAKVGHIFYRVCQGVDHHIQALVGFKRPSSGRASASNKQSFMCAKPRMIQPTQEWRRHSEGLKYSN